MFAVLFALVFIKNTEYFSRHFPARIIAGLLDNGDQLYIRFAQRTFIQAECQSVTKEPRWISTLRAIEKELITDSLVYRYKLNKGASDGFSDEEGTFSMCSFWYIECLAKSGEMNKAILYFEKMLGYANHLGLYSEQTSLRGEQLGNFPQAFTHLGLISAAYQLQLLLEQNNMS